MAKYNYIKRGAGVGKAGINVARRGIAKATTGKGTVIDSNMGNQFFKNIDDYARKLAKSNVGKGFDEQTGLISFAKGIKNSTSETIGGRIGSGAVKAGYITKDADGALADINYTKIAKAYVATSAAARIATGGGLYKDSQGNTNVIGLPFV